MTEVHRGRTWLSAVLFHVSPGSVSERVRGLRFDRLINEVFAPVSDNNININNSRRIIPPGRASV